MNYLQQTKMQNEKSIRDSVPTFVCNPAVQGNRVGDKKRVDLPGICNEFAASVHLKFGHLLAKRCPFRGLFALFCPQGESLALLGYARKWGPIPLCSFLKIGLKSM